jgi:hypothetical protein
MNQWHCKTKANNKDVTNCNTVELTMQKMEIEKTDLDSSMQGAGGVYLPSL